MAPHYKLTYFNVTGLGEPIRYMLAYLKTDFEDNRVEFDEFQKIKDTFPFGQLPVLEVDGKLANQSNAICRYLGKQAGLAGSNDWEALQIDSVVDAITDYRLNYTAWFREQDPTRKDAVLEKCLSTHNPYFLSRFEKFVTENKGFLANGKLSWADVYFGAVANMLRNITPQNSNLFDSYPGLKKLIQQVDNLPGIKEYIAKRQATVL